MGKVRLRIKEIANEKGINQSQLHFKAGVTPQLLHRYWHNRSGSVDLEALNKIAGALGVKVRDLFEDIEEAA